MSAGPLPKVWEDDVKDYADIIKSTLPTNHNLDTDDIQLIADVLVRSNRQKLKRRLQKLNFSKKNIQIQLDRQS